MLPDTTQHNTTNSALGYSESDRQFGLTPCACRIELSDSNNVFGRQTSRSLWSSLAASTLLAHIFEVIGLRSAEQMLRIAAPWIIAVVAGAFVFLKGATFCQLKRYAVGCGLLSADATHAKQSIAWADGCTGPWPAGVRTTGLINVFPEALRKAGAWMWASNMMTASRTAVALSIVDALELRSARWACTLWGHQNLQFWCNALRCNQHREGTFASLNYTMNAAFSA